MKLKREEIEIDKTDSFANCKLDRKKYASVLTSILNSYDDGFVLAINNKWGTGKTTFIKMWEQDLKKQGFQTIYFNAWENDFENNPLIALMGELKTLTDGRDEENFKKALKTAAVLSKHILPVIVQSIANKYMDTDAVKDAITGVTKGMVDVFEKDVEEYAKKKKSVIEFRENLSHLIANTNEGKPLVYIIDELDRCRPNYSVSILEQVKHFFTVPNIVFVLSVDKEQLGNAVRGVYGSDRIDADEYLRRFIDLEYSIPEPDKNVYSKFLYEYFEFDSFILSSPRNSYREFNNDRNNFLEISRMLFSNNFVTLRQQEKIYILSRLALRSFGSDMYVIPEVFLYLIFLKAIDEKNYIKIKNKIFTLEEFQKCYYDTLILKLKNDIEKDERFLMRLEAQLIVYYINYTSTGGKRLSIYERDSDTRQNVLHIKSLINNKSDELFLNIFENLFSYGDTGELDLAHFFNRIDLLEPLKS